MADELGVIVMAFLDWISPIIDYLKSPSVDTNFKLTKLKIRATRYTFIDEVLYKRSYTLPYLRC